MWHSLKFSSCNQTTTQVLVQNSSSSLSRNGPGSCCPVALTQRAKTPTTTHQLEQLFIPCLPERESLKKRAFRPFPNSKHIRSFFLRTHIPSPIQHWCLLVALGPCLFSKANPYEKKERDAEISHCLTIPVTGARYATRQTPSDHRVAHRSCRKGSRTRA